ncbi:MAG TPA: nitroreductase family protein [Candidatus Limnocylindria bacterium]|jgi:nitroreductase|nr:nitroreductase family protein [Candidatus Limnocylindria bacterium]
MHPIEFQDRPTNFPQTQVNGAPLKPITRILLERRATPHFRDEPLPEDYLEAILRLAAQAPSGYNLQPWRFLVVREPEGRKRLQKAAMGQAKVAEAPVVIIAFALKGGWRSDMDAILEEGVRLGVGTAQEAAKQREAITNFLGAFPAAVWTNRHTMIALTTMMLVAEAYGVDTAPMEGFDPEAVKKEFGLPAEAEVVALLALGFAHPPDKAYGGRLALSEIVHVERYGQPWISESP